MNPANDQPADEPIDPTAAESARRPAPAVSDPLAAAAELLDGAYITVMRHEPQLRRLGRAVRDVGLPVPADWAKFDNEQTVSFRPMTAKQFRRLVNVLEDIAVHLPEPVRYMHLPDDEMLFDEIVVGIANEAVFGPDFDKGFEGECGTAGGDSD